jgi:hypothetical protein
MHRKELQLLVDNWETIKEEMTQITNFHNDVMRPFTGAWGDLPIDIFDSIVDADGWSGVENSEKKWWNFPLFIYDGPTENALKMTPKTVDIIRRVGGVHFCGFSLLFGKAIIPPHFDSPACLDNPIGEITYHLGLICPEETCFLIHGKKATLEADGKLISFNCTKTHSAVNMSDSVRVVLYLTFKK